MQQAGGDMYQYLLFDLDGTLTDSGPGITKSAQYALRRCGIEVPDLKDLRSFVGPPLMESFHGRYGLSEERSLEAIGWYRERYGSVGIYENEVYPGIPHALKSLKDAGRKLIVASSKPEFYVRKILDHFDLGSFFDEAVGPAMDEKRSSKADVIEDALRRCGIKEEEKPRTVMIGDRIYDCEGAAKVGIDSIGVTYGFADAGELEQSGAVKLVSSASELERFLLGKEVTA